MPRSNEIGKRYEKLTVIEQVSPPPHIQKTGRINRFWLCQCDCGKTCVLRTGALHQGQKSCGCALFDERGPAAHAKLNEVGNIYGKVTVISQAETKLKYGKKAVYWLCKCECGKEFETTGAKLRIGKVTSCGFQPCHPKGRHKSLSQYSIISANTMYGATYNDGDISFDLFIDLSQKACFYCGVMQSNCFNRFQTKRGHRKIAEENGAFKYNGLDRIDNKFGHIISNVVTCCSTCNWMKNDLSKDEFIIHISKIFNYLKQDI